MGVTNVTKEEASLFSDIDSELVALSSEMKSTKNVFKPN